MAKNKSTAMYIVALLLFVGGAGFIAVSSLSANKVYFLNVSEALAAPAAELNAVRLFGTVGDEMERPDNGLGVKFLLRDADAPGTTIWVNYKGAVPDTFERGAEVIVEGGMTASAFEAKTLMTKCPSKYEKANRPTKA